MRRPIINRALVVVIVAELSPAMRRVQWRKQSSALDQKLSYLCADTPSIVLRLGVGEEVACSHCHSEAPSTLTRPLFPATECARIGGSISRSISDTAAPSCGGRTGESRRRAAPRSTVVVAPASTSTSRVAGWARASAGHSCGLGPDRSLSGPGRGARGGASLWNSYGRT